MTATIFRLQTQLYKLKEANKIFIKIHTTLMKNYRIDITADMNDNAYACRYVVIQKLAKMNLRHREIGEIMSINTNTISSANRKATTYFKIKDPLYMKWHGIIETGLKDINNK